MVDIAEQLVKKWERLNGDEEIDVVHDMTALTLDTIGLCGFDYRFNSFYRRDYHPFVELLVRSLETIMMTRGIPLEGLWLQKRRRDLAQDVAFMNKMVDEIIAERRGNAEAAEGKKDMLGAMMTGVDRATGEQLDDVNIRYQINTFLIAGHETTSGLLSCTIYALLKHPEVLKKAYEEVDRVLGPDINARPTYQQVTQLTYITQILKEALRLWPPAPAYGIAPLQDETIGGKYKLRKNTFRHGARDGAASRSQSSGVRTRTRSIRRISAARPRPSARSTPGSRSATASAPASAAALRCTRRRSRSA